MGKNTLRGILICGLLLLFASGCTNAPVNSSLSGNYSGAVRQNGNFTGAWKATAGGDGELTLTVKILPVTELSGRITNDGDFTVVEDSSSGDGQSSGTITGENVSGILYTSGETYDITGRKFHGENSYIGTWYEKTDLPVYRKYVIQSEYFTVYTDNNGDGNYTEDEKEDEGTFTVDGSNFTFVPQAGSFSGIYYCSEDDYLILAPEGLTNFYLISTDRNPAAQ